jgi:phage terminase large subunit
VVFNNWKEIDTIPKEAKLIGIGLDFGYTNDPTAAIEIYNYNGTRIINELVYRTGMVNSDIAKILPSGVIFTQIAQSLNQSKKSEGRGKQSKE